MTSLDYLLPTYDFSERHRRQIATPPGAFWTVVTEIGPTLDVYRRPR